MPTPSPFACHCVKTKFYRNILSLLMWPLRNNGYVRGITSNNFYGVSSRFIHPASHYQYVYILSVDKESQSTYDYQILSNYFTLLFIFIYLFFVLFYLQQQNSMMKATKLLFHILFIFIFFFVVSTAT